MNLQDFAISNEPFEGVEKQRDLLLWTHGDQKWAVAFLGGMMIIAHCGHEIIKQRGLLPLASEQFDTMWNGIALQEVDERQHERTGDEKLYNSPTGEINLEAQDCGLSLYYTTEWAFAKEDGAGPYLAMRLQAIANVIEIGGEHVSGMLLAAIRDYLGTNRLPLMVKWRKVPVSAEQRVIVIESGPVRAFIAPVEIKKEKPYLTVIHDMPPFVLVRKLTWHEGGKWTGDSVEMDKYQFSGAVQ